MLLIFKQVLIANILIRQL